MADYPGHPIVRFRQQAVRFCSRHGEKFNLWLGEPLEQVIARRQQDKKAKEIEREEEKL